MEYAKLYVPNALPGVGGLAAKGKVCRDAAAASVEERNGTCCP